MSETGIIIVAALLGLSGLVYFLLRKKKLNFKQVIQKISSEYRRDVVIPDGLDGLIELEHLLLTPHGLLVIDYRDAQGTVFPGENLEQWPIMQEGRRTSINNPYTGLKHRVTAVKGLVDDVPIIGVLVFPDEVQFGNAPPENVLHVSELYKRYRQKDAEQSQLKIPYQSRFDELVTYVQRST